MLRHPVSLAEWQRWQDRRHPLRALKSRVRRTPPSGVLTGGPDADLLVVLDSASPSSRAALLAPLAHLPAERVAVLAPGGDGAPWTGGPLPRVRAVLSAGHYLALGAAAHAHAVRTGATSYVVQHGLLTPHSPPLPPGATALAWSAADADFWRSGRDDVAAVVVGSQILHEAAQHPAVPHPGARPTYLGQLHAAELPRRDLARAAREFCLTHGATYRPHPSERDRLSRRAHARWEAAGVRIERDGEVRGPVVSVFSTGVLEAAARGLPAYADLPEPPAWLRELWRRYRMHRPDEGPTPAPASAEVEPARAIAEVLAR